MDPLEPPDLDALARAIRASWGPDTCDPCDLENWSTGPPSKGMCIVTSLVLQDYLGGELLEAKVFVGDEQPGYHTWLILDGVEIDLTRDQFTPEEVVGEAYLVPRITGPDMRLAEQYETLRARVAAALAEDPS